MKSHILTRILFPRIYEPFSVRELVADQLSHFPVTGDNETKLAPDQLLIQPTAD